MAQEALEVVKLRKDFYRDSYRLVLTVLLVAVIIIVILSGIIAYQASHRPTPTYFATTMDGKLIPMIPLDQPNLNDQSVLQWVATAVVSLYTYDFLNFRATFQNNQQYFTPDGWRAFLAGLTTSRNLQTVQDKKLTVQAVPAGAPIITKEGLLDGRYAWQVQIPILVTYVSLSQESYEHLLLTVLVQRLSTLDSKYGIGIAQLVVQQQ